MFFRISGNAASDKNIKENVCAQMEKNFARAKWKVIIYVQVVITFLLFFFAHHHLLHCCSFEEWIVFVFVEEHSRNDEMLLQVWM